VRSSILFVLLLACDHRPAPKQEPPPPPTQVVVDAGAAAVATADAPPPTDEACVQVGAKIADIIISNTPDPTQKAAYEQERTKLVKRFADNCTKDTWPENVRTCFLAAKTPADIEVCSRDLVKPAPQQPPPADVAPAGAH
jgi:hypothetical protein